MPNKQIWTFDESKLESEISNFPYSKFKKKLIIYINFINEHASKKSKTFNVRLDLIMYYVHNIFLLHFTEIMMK